MEKGGDVNVLNMKAIIILQSNLNVQHKKAATRLAHVNTATFV